MLIIGGGKMGSAIVGGLVRSGAKDLTILETSDGARESLSAQFGDAVNIVSVMPKAESVVVAVKPKDVESVVFEAANQGAKRVLSIAAGVTLAKLHDAAGAHIGVVRAMPNIGAICGQSASAVCVHPSANPADLHWAFDVLSTFGDVVQVTEAQMDAVTGLSGSGPAYVALFMEALVDAGIAQGLNHDDATRLSAATIAGASALLSMGIDPKELRHSVTTPAGTTAAGLCALEERGFRAAVAAAVDAAAKRSAELVGDR